MNHHFLELNIGKFTHAQNRGIICNYLLILKKENSSRLSSLAQLLTLCKNVLYIFLVLKLSTVHHYAMQNKEIFTSRDKYCVILPTSDIEIHK